MSILAVQQFATRRNQQAEALVGCVLANLGEHLARKRALTAPYRLVPQAIFIREDSSDVFDHQLVLPLVAPLGGLSGVIQLWSQTTCYKGNPTNTPEPNKTYEIRETLIESLGLRQWLTAEDVTFRTIHFTVGPASYGYGWLKSAKNASFDLSLYPPLGTDIDELFAELETLLATCSTDLARTRKLHKTMGNGASKIGRLITEWTAEVIKWFDAGAKPNPMADKQAALLKFVRNLQRAALKNAIADSKLGGANIKGQAVALYEGGESDDPLLIATVKQVVAGNQFLGLALEAESNWALWAKQHLSNRSGSDDVQAYVRHLWRLPLPARLISRRLLIRIHDPTARYAADLGIDGLTEHNLYAGDVSDAQLVQVVEAIAANCISHGIATASELEARLVGISGKKLCTMSRRLESRNGTSLKPSFLYVEQALKPVYACTSFAEAGLVPPIGYHSTFGISRVGSYANLKVVIRSKDKEPVAILKAKFFRQPEFPRRAKEEAYVGLTARFKYSQGSFEERYPGLPLVMFVDMAARLTPPEFAVARLVNSGWYVVFSIKSLRRFLGISAE